MARLARLIRRGVVPWLLVGALSAALVVAIVWQRSTASDRDRTATQLSASRAALARTETKLSNLQAKLEYEQIELRSMRVRLRLTAAMLAVPRRAMLRDRRFKIAFLRGKYPYGGSAVVLASIDGTIERTLLNAADLRAELFGKRFTIGSFTPTCEHRVVFDVAAEDPTGVTGDGSAELLDNGELREGGGGECPPSAHHGTTLVYNGGVVRARYGKTEKNLFATDQGIHGTRESITLSPDGERVAFVLDASGSSGVQVMNTRTRQQLALARSLPKYWQKGNLAWAPDSRRIAVTLRPPDVGELGFDPGKPPAWLNGAEQAVVIIDRRGHVLTRIANAADAAWSTDGRMIAFDSSRDGRRNVYVADADGSGIRQVTHASHASWSPYWR